MLSKHNPFCSWNVSKKLFYCDADTAEVVCCLFDDSKEYSERLKYVVAMQIVINKLENKFQNSLFPYEDTMYEVLCEIQNGED